VCDPIPEPLDLFRLANPRTVDHCLEQIQYVINLPPFDLLFQVLLKNSGKLPGLLTSYDTALFLKVGDQIALELRPQSHDNELIGSRTALFDQRFRPGILG